MAQGNCPNHADTFAAIAAHHQRLITLEKSNEKLIEELEVLRETVRNLVTEVKMIRRALYFIGIAILSHAELVSDIIKSIQSFARLL